MSENGVLHGLKAKQGTDTERPPLRGILVPRFWGSYDRRWELARLHLVPVNRHAACRALCGHQVGVTGEDELPGDFEPLDPAKPLPSGRDVCKKCRAVATKRGY